MTLCTRCSQALSRDEIGLSRKLINRGTTSFYCFACLEDMFHIPRTKLDEMIEAYRSAGCSMFL